MIALDPDFLRGSYTPSRHTYRNGGVDFDTFARSVIVKIASGGTRRARDRPTRSEQPDDDERNELSARRGRDRGRPASRGRRHRIAVIRGHAEH